MQCQSIVRIPLHILCVTVNKHTYVHVYMYTNTYTHKHTYMYVYIYTYLFIHMYAVSKYRATTPTYSVWYTTQTYICIM